MKENGTKEIEIEQGYIAIKMEIDMTEIGVVIKRKEKVFITTVMATEEWEIIEMISPLENMFNSLKMAMFI